MLPCGRKLCPCRLWGCSDLPRVLVSALIMAATLPLQPGRPHCPAPTLWAAHQSGGPSPGQQQEECRCGM